MMRAALQERLQHFGLQLHEAKTRFVVKRKTPRQRVTAKLQTLNEEVKRRRHEPVRDQHQWLCQLLRATLYSSACRSTSAR